MESRKKIQIGSHLDTVKKGGNFDGVAGVLIGFEAIRSLVQLGPLGKNLELVIWRGEESGTFDVAFKGSKGAFGQLSPAALEKTFQGKTLREAIEEAGFDPTLIEKKTATISQNEIDSIDAHLEFHIEQARVLESSGIVLGVGTSIRGPARSRYSVQTFDGSPLDHRIVAEIIVRLHSFVRKQNDAGLDLVGTFGVVNTESAPKDSQLQHCGLSSVPGYAEIRLFPPHISRDSLRERIEPIERTFGISTEVEYDDESVIIRVFGQFDHSGATPMKPGFRKNANLAASQIILDSQELYDVATLNFPEKSDTAVLALDLRSDKALTLESANEDFFREVEDLCEREGVRVSREVLPAASPVEELDPNLQRILQSSAAELGFSSTPLPSGAGHDVGIVSQAKKSDLKPIPTALGLIECRDGLSHCEQEYVSSIRLAQACQIAVLSLLKLSQ